MNNSLSLRNECGVRKNIQQLHRYADQVDL